METNDKYFMLTLGPTCKFIPPQWYKGVGKGVDGSPLPPQCFRSINAERNYFALNRKLLEPSSWIRHLGFHYFLWKLKLIQNQAKMLIACEIIRIVKF